MSRFDTIEISLENQGGGMKERNGKQKMNEREENACPRCRGTGMVCGHEPEILPGACCADFANAICPECEGTGKNPLLKPGPPPEKGRIGY